MLWKEVLKEETSKPYFAELASFLRIARKTKNIYPSHNDTFKAFQLTKFDDIKVVILGQDPYHGEGQANGLAFSVNNDMPYPPSLLNIIKEVESDVITMKTYGLDDWAKQGVFLLNSVLTVEEGKPGSHSNKGWETFTEFVISQISEKRKNIVFILWGEFAKQKAKLIDTNKHLILTSPHPSPLSAYRGFFGCKHFSKTNEYLISNNIEPIIW